MTFIPKKLRLLPLSIAVITALSFSTAAFAATVNYETSYGLDNYNNVTVSATATGVVSGDEITFLVNTVPTGTGGTIANNDIVYIDQQKATSSIEKFTFTTKDSKFSSYSSAVKFGSSGAGYTYTAQKSSNVLNTASPRLVTNPVALIKSTSNTVVADNYILAFGTIANGGGGVGVYEYGILYSETSGELEKLTTYESVNLLNSVSGISKKFPASNINTSRNNKDQFAIKLINYTSGKLQDGKYVYTRTYVAYADATGKNVVTLGNIVPTQCN